MIFFDLKVKLPNYIKSFYGEQTGNLQVPEPTGGAAL